MMGPEQFYLCWKILVLTQDSIQQMLARRLTKTGFDTRDERALMHPKSARERSDEKKKGYNETQVDKEGPQYEAGAF